MDDFIDEIIDFYYFIVVEWKFFYGMGIDFEEKVFYDIFKVLAYKYDFEYFEDKFIYLAKEVKIVVEDKVKYIDWSKWDDIKVELKVDFIILLVENDYFFVDWDEVYKEIFE